MDTTLQLNMVMLWLRLGCAIALVALTLALVYRLYRGYNVHNRAEIEMSWLHVLRQNWLLGLLWTILVVTGGYLMTVETAYRPKNSVGPTKSVGRETGELPPLKSAPPAPTWEEVREANRAENKAAREAFRSLPQVKQEE